MHKKVVVISLGGSLIVPEEIDKKFISEFKKTLEQNYKKYKFVVVCGGGTVARKYISLLESQNLSQKELSLAGIRITRLNASMMSKIFGKKANQEIPKSTKEVISNLKKNQVVFCGALRYAQNETSDGTSAKIARKLKSEFINMTNIDGLYSSNPKTNKNAKFIEKESWKEFERRANKIKYHPGQHFVLDQNASKIIKNNQIVTYIIGKDLSNLSNLLNHKSFRGTTIKDD